MIPILQRFRKFLSHGQVDSGASTGSISCPCCDPLFCSRRFAGEQSKERDGEVRRERLARKNLVFIPQSSSCIMNHFT